MLDLKLELLEDQYERNASGELDYGSIVTLNRLRVDIQDQFVAAENLMALASVIQEFGFSREIEAMYGNSLDALGISRADVNAAVESLWGKTKSVFKSIWTKIKDVLMAIKDFLILPDISEEIFEKTKARNGDKFNMIVLARQTDTQPLLKTLGDLNKLVMDVSELLSKINVPGKKIDIASEISKIFKKYSSNKHFKANKSILQITLPPSNATLVKQGLDKFATWNKLDVAYRELYDTIESPSGLYGAMQTAGKILQSIDPNTESTTVTDNGNDTEGTRTTTTSKHPVANPEQLQKLMINLRSFIAAADTVLDVAQIASQMVDGMWRGFISYRRKNI